MNPSGRAPHSLLNKRSSSDETAISPQEPQEFLVRKSTMYGNTLVRSSKKNICPICQKDHGCRFTPDGSYVMCLRGDSFPSVSGYRRIGQLRSGMGWQFLKNQDFRQSFTVCLSLDATLRDKDKEDKTKTEPPVEKRHAEYLELCACLNLEEDHRQNLLSRGLNNLQIELGLFRTANPRQKVLISQKESILAGVTHDGRFLTNLERGFICPVFNVDKQVVGWQLRLDNPSDGGKYKWAKTFSLSRGDKTVHVNGELPINVAYPVGLRGKKQTILITEGILKSYIVAQLSKCITLGASGGHFPLKQLKTTLKKLESIYNIEKIIICPDSGSLLNQHVISALSNLLKTLEEIGIPKSLIKVADWGQLFSRKNDTTNNSASTCDYDEFLARGYKDKQVRLHPVDGFFQLCTEATLDILKEKKQKNSETPSRIKPIGDKAPFPHGSITPTSLIEQRYLDFDEKFFAEGIYCFKSPMGTGKTELLKKIVYFYPEGNVLSYRNALLRNTSWRIPLLKLWSELELVNEDGSEIDDETQNLLIQHYPWVAACVDSIQRLAPKEVLVIEEVQKTLKHLLAGKTCKQRRNLILEKFKLFCQKARVIICFDADLTDTEVKYLQEISGKPVNTVVNTFIGAPWQVTFYEAPKDSPKVPKNDYSEFLGEILISLFAGKKILVVSDSQRWLEALEVLIKNSVEEKNILRVDSFEVIGNRAEDVQAFLESPSDWLERNKPDCLLLSPVGEASLDIAYPAFDEVFGYFEGILDAYSTAQLLGRYREAVPRKIFIKDRKVRIPNVVPNFKVIGKYCLAQLLEAVKNDDSEFLYEVTEDNAEASVQLVVGSLISRLEKIVTDFKSDLFFLTQIHERYVRQKQDLRNSLIYLLRQAGHRVATKIGVGSFTLYQFLKQYKREILVKRAEKIANSPDIDDSSLERLKRRPQHVSDVWKVEKAILKKRLPGVELTPEFVYWCLFDEPNIIRSLERRWYLNHFEEAERLFGRRLAKCFQNKVLPWDVDTTQIMKIKLFKEINALKWVSESWCEEAVLNSSIPSVLAHCKDMLLHLGYSLPVDAVRFLKGALKDLGYVVKSSKTRSGSRLYQVKFEIGREFFVDTAYQAISKRLSEKTVET